MIELAVAVRIAIAVGEILPAGNTLFHALLLHHVGQKLLDVGGIADPFDVHLGSRLVGGAAVDGAKAEHPLPEGALEGHVHDAVQPDLFFVLVENAGLDEQLLLGERVLGKGPGQTENDALAVGPNDVFCHNA